MAEDWHDYPESWGYSHPHKAVWAQIWTSGDTDNLPIILSDVPITCAICGRLKEVTDG